MVGRGIKSKKILEGPPIDPNRYVNDLLRLW